MQHHRNQGPGNLPKMPKWVSVYTEKSVIPAWATQGGGRVLVNGLGSASRPGCSPSPWIPIKQVLSGVFVCVDLGPGHQGDRDSTAELQEGQPKGSRPQPWKPVESRKVQQFRKVLRTGSQTGPEQETDPQPKAEDVTRGTNKQGPWCIWVLSWG